MRASPGVAMSNRKRSKRGRRTAQSFPTSANPQRLPAAAVSERDGTPTVKQFIKLFFGVFATMLVISVVGLVNSAPERLRLAREQAERAVAAAKRDAAWLAYRDARCVQARGNEGSGSRVRVWNCPDMPYEEIDGAAPRAWAGHPVEHASDDRADPTHHLIQVGEI